MNAEPELGLGIGAGLGAGGGLAPDPILGGMTDEELYESFRRLPVR